MGYPKLARSSHRYLLLCQLVVLEGDANLKLVTSMRISPIRTLHYKSVSR
ncbi:unnamed protein product [Strongylus vulgaris]|uniref:Uncharacterized protein n=1 Tax=Strongylus vulgaris TaxID=40348 RepID=A0A3P7L076_STRVU|nr:unnamed protein product [Strongylus vulgaris]